MWPPRWCHALAERRCESRPAAGPSTPPAAHTQAPPTPASQSGTIAARGSVRQWCRALLQPGPVRDRHRSSPDLTWPAIDLVPRSARAPGQADALMAERRDAARLGPVIDLGGIPRPPIRSPNGRHRSDLARLPRQRFPTMRTSVHRRPPSSVTWPNTTGTVAGERRRTEANETETETGGRAALYGA